MNASGPFNLLCPFQKRWLADRAALAIGEKSRRIGWTWTQALGAVLDRVEGNSDYFHSSADMTASTEFIEDCADWAKMVNAVAVVEDEKEVIGDEEINTLVMRFANGNKIVAGSSNPKFFRSKGGAAGLDEFAFHARGRDLFKAAHATAMFWGYPLRVWSTHNGPGSYFNRLLTQAREGKLAAALHKVTILDAVADGIVERIDMRRLKLDHVPEPDDVRRPRVAGGDARHLPGRGRLERRVHVRPVGRRDVAALLRPARRRRDFESGAAGRHHAEPQPQWRAALRRL
jgi:phage FluMu gp28-like protein